MKAQYRAAVISFCEDLTRSDSPTHPVGVFVATDYSNGERQASLLVSTSGLPDHFDELTQIFVRGLPQVLQNQIDVVFASCEGKPLDDMFEELCDALRNTVHVSYVTPVLELDVEMPDFLPSTREPVWAPDTFSVIASARRADAHLRAVPDQGQVYSRRTDDRRAAYVN
jgi:hypothetical protein